jgi:hypothetical protein
MIDTGQRPGVTTSDNAELIAARLGSRPRSRARMLGPQSPGRTGVLARNPVEVDKSLDAEWQIVKQDDHECHERDRRPMELSWPDERIDRVFRDVFRDVFTRAFATDRLFEA